MKSYFAIFLLSFVGLHAEFISKDPTTLDARLLKARKILDEVPLIDGHNDLAKTLHDILDNQLSLFPFEQDLTSLEPWASNRFSQTDLPKLREGKIGAQFWAASVPCYKEPTDFVLKGIKQIDVIKRIIQKYPDDLQFADSSDGIYEAFENGKIASLIGVEGGHMINGSLAVLRMFYDAGARYLTLTHMCDVAWAESSVQDENKAEGIKGLSDFGKMVVSELNRLGMMVDISHTSDNTMEDVFAVTAAPVIFSHSSARALCNHTRNVPNNLLRKLKRNGGVIMVNFYPTYVTCSDNATIHDVIDHINHIRNITGIDHVGIGSDFNGIDLVPEGLENVGTFPYIFAELLLDPKWTEADLKKLAGLNLLRVFELVESVKMMLQSEKANEALISDPD